MRKEKQLLLDEISDLLEKSQSHVITRYNKMNPNLFYDFRVRMGNAGGEFEVLKKRVLKKAAEARSIPLDSVDLSGHIGILFAMEDPISVAKELVKFSKENDQTFEILGGQFEGKFCSPEDVKEIALLPSKDEMRAQLLSVFEAPMSQTLSVVDSLLTSVLHCLENKCSAANEASSE